LRRSLSDQSTDEPVGVRGGKKWSVSIYWRFKVSIVIGHLSINMRIRPGSSNVPKVFHIKARSSCELLLVVLSFGCRRWVQRRGKGFRLKKSEMLFLEYITTGGWSTFYEFCNSTPSVHNACAIMCCYLSGRSLLTWKKSKQLRARW